MIHMFALGAYVFVNSYIVPNITSQNAAAGSAMLNLTRQQVANYVILYDDLTEDERQVLDKMVEVDAVREHYNPELSDDIWSITNKRVTTEETADYLKLWFKLFSDIRMRIFRRRSICGMDIFILITCAKRNFMSFMSCTTFRTVSIWIYVIPLAMLMRGSWPNHGRGYCTKYR